MKKGKRQRKDKLIGFRATGSEVHSLDVLAELVGTSRSDVIRRFLPDLTGAKKLTPSMGA